MGDAAAGAVTLFLAGDVMTGRGIDQALPYPGDPRLWEPAVSDARTYLRLAEQRHGPVPYPVAPAWPWGEAGQILDQLAPDVRLINLETSVTRRGAPAPQKAVHYRMTPENIDCLTAARPHGCALANNHVLDFGQPGLADTLRTLAQAGIRTAGAGPDLAAAARPAVLPVRSGVRVRFFSTASASSGVPPHWAATADRAGVWLLPDLSGETARDLAGRVRQARRPGDVTVVSIHWGSNWGYRVDAAQVSFAHYLVEHGVDVVHGHSSHHPRPIDLHHGRLILYGCGDLINDYEGIGGYERYRDDLRLLYLATLRPGTGELLDLRMVPVQARRLSLWRAAPADAAFLCRVLDQVSRPFGVQIALTEQGWLAAAPDRAAVE